MEEVRPADWYYKFIRQLLVKEHQQGYEEGKKESIMAIDSRVVKELKGSKEFAEVLGIAKQEGMQYTKNNKMNNKQKMNIELSEEDADNLLKQEFYVVICPYRDGTKIWNEQDYLVKEVGFLENGHRLILILKKRL